MVFDERIVTRAVPKAAFAFLGDMNRMPSWDPAVTAVEQLVPGAVGLGTRFRVNLRFLGFDSVLDYHVETWEPPRRAILMGTSSAVSVTDTIVVTPWHGGSRIRWKAEIRLVFPFQVVDPAVAWLFRANVQEAVSRLKTRLDSPAIP